MIKTTLQAAGLPCWPAECSSPPPGAYGLYFDSVTVDGSDGLEAMVLRHDAMVELYAPTKAAMAEAEAAYEAQLVAAKLAWTKQPWYWLRDIKRYQAIYEFTYNEKRRT